MIYYLCSGKRILKLNLYDKKNHQHDRIERNHIGFVRLEA